MASIFWTLGASDNWDVAADWSTDTVPGLDDDAVLGITGFAIVQNYTVSVTTTIDVGSITISDTGAVMSIASPGAVSVATNISNFGEVALQNGGSLAVSEDFSNAAGGSIDVDASGSGGSSLSIVGTLTNSGKTTVGGTSLTAPSATLTTGGGVDNDDDVLVDGGGTLTISGTLTNNANANVTIGGSNAPATLKAQALDNTGTIDIDGGPTAGETATLDIAEQPATWTGALSVSGFGLLEFSVTSQIDANDGVIDLSGPHAFVADAGLGLDGDTALTGLASNYGQLQLQNGASLTTGGGLDNENSGDVYVDNGGSGGSTLTIGGTLTNSGNVTIGGFNVAGTLNAQALDNTGTIDINGGPTAAETATLDVAEQPATWTGVLSISGYGLLEFSGTSQIGSIAGGAVIDLSGPHAFVADAGLGLGDDTALSGLASNAGDLTLQSGASLTTGGGLDNSGNVSVYDDGALTIGGTLSNSNSVQIGGFDAPATLNAQGLDNTGTIDINGGATAAETATLDVAEQPTTWTGVLSISGYGLLEFSGTSQIGSIAKGGVISLSGAQAFVADAGLGVGDDTALTGLASNMGTLQVHGGASLTTGGGLDNSGAVSVYDNSTLTIGGTLTNSDSATVGGFNQPATLNAQGLNNTSAGTITIGGGATSAATAILDVTAQLAPAKWTGTLSIASYGLLEFSGTSQIEANDGVISLAGPQAFVADAGLGLDDDTALSGLASNTGTLSVYGGASLTTDVGFDNINENPLNVSVTVYRGGALTIGGTLTNSADVDVGGFDAPATVSAQGLDNTDDGLIRISGGATATETASLEVTAQSAPATWTGALDDSGYGLLEFSGTSQIGAIGPHGSISLSGPDAFVADAGLGIGDDSALTGLASNAGGLSLQSGASLTTDGGLDTSGNLQLDFGGSGGSTLTIGGALTNSGSVQIGPLNVGGRVNAEGLENTGTIFLNGNSSSAPILNVTGSATNANTITLQDYSDMSVSGAFTDSGAIDLGGSLDLGGDLTVTGTGSLVMQGGEIITPDDSMLTIDAGGVVSGDGAISLAVANSATLTASGGLLDVAGPITGAGELAIASASELELGGATSETVAFGGDVGTLKLDQPQSFTGGFTGLVKGDTIDLAGVQATSAVVTGSTLTVTAGTQTLSYQVSGSGLSGNDFAVEDDQQGGTDLVLGPPGPTISAPTTQTAFLGWPTLLGPLTIADPNDGDGSLTVTITAGTGTLTGVAANAGTLTGSGGQKLVLTGDLADINTMLASLTYGGASAGSDTVHVQVTDAGNLTTAQNITVTTEDVPFTESVLNSPASEILIAGTPTALPGISVSDPYAQVTGQDLTLYLVDLGILTASGGPGGTVEGQGTNSLSITGTVQAINSYFADSTNSDLPAKNEYPGAQQAATMQIAVAQKSIFGNLPKTQAIISQLQNLLETLPSIKNAEDQAIVLQAIRDYTAQLASIPSLTAADLTTYGLAGLVVLQLVALVTYAAYLAWIASGNENIVTSSGLLYPFDGSGEFILGLSTQPGDSFQVQARFQPDNNSSSGSVVTQIAALVGSDRVTIGVIGGGRAAPVMIDGTPVTVSQNNPITLTGGQLKQIAAGTYQISWDTGEILTVTDYGSRLDLQLGLPSGEAPGSIVGLMGPNGEPQSDTFELPNGTVLQQPLSTNELYQTFAQAWLVPPGFSLFDYGPGQSPSTLDNPNFPTAPITLADLPSNVVAAAKAVVAAAGITNPNIAAVAEFDYLVRGGDIGIVESDASAFQGVTTTSANITPSGPAPAVLGVIPNSPSVAESQSGSTPVKFEVYLTEPESNDTEVDYQVIAPNAVDLGASAFGGTLPSGETTIAANATSGSFTIDVPQGALGGAASGTLAVEISTPSGISLFAPDGQATLLAPQPGTPPVPQLVDLTSFGNFTQNGNNYTLDLGAVQLGETLPTLQFAIENAATAPSDQLTGTISWSTVAGFNMDVDGTTTSGVSLPSPIAAGQSFDGLTATINQDKFGANGETITFNPVDTNASGYSSALAPITLTIADTLEVPGMIYSQAFGDVHIITYNGLEYSFQAVGEFTLAKSNIADDSFDIQLRLQPYLSSSSVTVITEVAASLGAADVTFSAGGIGQPVSVRVNGQTVSLSMSDPTLTLAGGSITEVSPTLYKVAWNTGESMTVTESSFHSPVPYLNVTDAVPYATFGEVSGLQGENEGTQNDFQLPDGTVLQQPLTSDQLYGEYANAWRVGAANSLMYYAPNTSYATFDVPDFPTDSMTLDDLPASVVANAAALVAAAGITDPVTAANAELDYVATGDPSFIASAANVNQQVTGTVAPMITPSTMATAAIGVAATATKVTEAANGSTAVIFTAYLTAAETSDTTIDYTAGLGAGALPSGEVTIAAGQTSAQITVDVPQGALGAAPDETLEIQVSSPDDAVPIFAPTAETEIVNNQPEPGSPAVPVLAYLGNVGAFSFDSATETYTLNLGGVTQGASIDAAEFAVVNAAAGASDNLAGTFTAPTGEGFIVTGDNLPSPLVAGQSYDGLYASVNTADLGANGMSLTFNPLDVNDSGYSQALTPLTLKIVDSVVAEAVPRINTPTTIIFPNAHVGATVSQHVSITNTAGAGAADLDVSLSASGAATASGKVSDLAQGATDASDLSVGIDTSAAGAVSGSVTETFVSDGGGGNTSPIAEQDPYIDVFGSVYRLAEASISPGDLTVHVGDSGSQPITITNIDADDSYSENLIATVVGTTGALTAGGTTGDIAPQADATIAVRFSTSTPGPVGTVTLDLKSDGTGIDGLGVTDLGDVTIPVAVTATNAPAAAEFEEISGGGTFSNKGVAYSLDLGTISAPATVSLGVLDSGEAPADALSGSFQISGPSEFVNSGFGAFSGVAAGEADTAPTVTLDTGLAGAFSETITLDPMDAVTNAALPVETLTITGTIATPTPPPTITAPASVDVTAGVASAVSGVSVADSNAGASVTVTLSDANGALAANAGGVGGGGVISGDDSTTLTVSGTLGQVNADLRTLTDTDSAPGDDVILVTADDSFGGQATPATITVVPAAPATVTINPVDGDNVINYAEAHAASGVALSGTVSGLAAGATFSISVVDGSFDATYSATVNSAANGWTATIPEAAAVTLPEGSATVTAEVNASEQASETVTVAETLPTVTISPVEGDNVITSAEAQASGGVPLSGTVSGLAAGATFAVSVVDGLFSASYSATVDAAATGWTATIPEADAITLPNGTATVTTQVTGAYGNVSAEATDNVTVAETLPTVTISPVEGDNVINYAEAQAASGVPLSGTVSGLAAGATFAVSVVDGSFSESYTATVNAAATDWTATIPEAAAVTLPEGTATVSTQVTDAYGNVSARATDSVTVAGTLPTVTIAPIDGDNVVNNAEANAAAGVSLSGTVTGLAAGATFSVAVADGGFAKSYTATVDAAGTGWTATIPEADAIRLPNGTATLTSQVTDAYGNSSTQASDNVEVAETLPTVTIAAVDGDNVINNAAAQAAAGVTLTGQVTGLAGGATFSVAVADGSFSKSYTATVNSGATGWTAAIPQTDAITLSNGTATISAQVTDAYDNVSTSATDNVTVQETLPTVTIASVDGDNIINNAEAHASAGAALSGTVSGLAKGATFLVSVTDGSFSESYSATVNSAATGWSATIPEVDAIALPNGTATIGAQVTDAYGNVSTQASDNVTVQETLPTVTIAAVGGDNIINNAEAHASAGLALSGTVSGLAQGATFLVSVTDGSFSESYSATVNSAVTGWSAAIPEADATTLPNGTATISAQVTDAYGNVSLKATDSVTVQETLPMLTIAAVDGDNIIDSAEAHASAGVALSGTLSGLAAGATFSVSVADGGFSKSYTATVDAAGTGWSAAIPEADAIKLPNGTATISARVTDAYGNVSTQASDNVTVAETLPTVTIAAVDGDNIIDSAEAHASAGVALSGTLSGLAAGATFSVSVADGGFSKSYTATVDAAGTGWSAAIPEADAIKLPNGTATVTAIVSATIQASEKVVVAETLPTVTINEINGDNIVDNSSRGDCGNNRGEGCCSRDDHRGKGDDDHRDEGRNNRDHGEGGRGKEGGPTAVQLSGAVTGVASNSTFQVTVTDAWFDKTYTATVDAAGSGWTATIPVADVAELPNGLATVTATVIDAFGNVSLPAVQRVTVEGTTPIVLSITAQPSSGDFDAGKTIAITLNMNEAVVVTGEPTLQLNDCGVATFDKAASTATKLIFDYTVGVGQNTKDLEVTGVALGCDASIGDSSGDPANFAGAAASLGLVVDTTPPVVKCVTTTPACGEVETGRTVEISLALSEDVTVSGSPWLLLSDGGVATYDAAHSTATSLAFDYLVGAGQTTSDLRIVGVESPPDASILDRAGNAAELIGAGGDLDLSINTSAHGVGGSGLGPLTIAALDEIEVFGASSANVTFASSTGGELVLDAARYYSGEITGFGGGDEIDLAGFQFGAHAMLRYMSSHAGTGGALTINDGFFDVAELTLTGKYNSGSFELSADGHSGTSITYR